MAAPPVELRAVVKRYGTVAALDGLTLSVAPGEVLGLLGHNGAGKTTTMKLVLGVIGPSAGVVRLFGADPRGGGARALRRGVGYLPESVSLYDKLTGREVLRYFARLKGVGAGAVERLLERVGLAAAAGRRVGTWSKGMRQRLGLAQALLGEPGLLLLDEPTAGLDPAATGELYAMIGELRRRGVTVVLSSHVLPGVAAHIDRAAILAGGRVQALGDLPALRERAGLPLTVRVRGLGDAAETQARLARLGATLRRADAGGVELTTPPEHKLAVMRLLLDEPGVTDIDVAAPSLEALYAHYNAAAAGER